MGSQRSAKGAQHHPPLLGPCLLWPRLPISGTAELLFFLPHVYFAPTLGLTHWNFSTIFDIRKLQSLGHCATVFELTCLLLICFYTTLACYRQTTNGKTLGHSICHGNITSYGKKTLQKHHSPQDWRIYVYGKLEINYKVLQQSTECSSCWHLHLSLFFKRPSISKSFLFVTKSL